ncbi:MAG TPA: bifunctional serine/threonine-protein kinase/formylglycine-generating enzyme family protein [Steroidobacteraceae bacterium]|jgi:formylglycine-generating enzyme required for sulfatase activity|nr:bifunctional serine/threonine-protein kinase/formylglycine-generating enzyme family protein [Steroidobacteraceae bacterium]
MTTPGKAPPGSTPASVSDEAKTIWLDLSTPVEVSPQTVDRIMDKGSTLNGRYRLLELIGEGRMSRVFKAVDQQKVESRVTDPNIAIKVLTVPFVNYSDAMDVLAREILSLHGSAHPNIARVMECERDGDTVFIPMDLLPGQSLLDRLEGLKTPMPKADALRIVKGITDALQFAHGKNIVHGDLKPGNVMLTGTNHAKVTDFSLARLMALSSNGPSRMTRATGRMKVLPPSYASPEVLEVGRLDPRDDVFALACIAWKLLTGEHPFKGKSALAAREAGMKLTCPSQLSEREFNALSHGLEFERNKRTLSPRQFYIELSGKSAGPSKAVIGAIAALVLGAVMLAAYFALNSGSDKLKQADSAAIPDEAPAVLPPGAVFRDCATCPLMKVVAPGQFMQGSAPNDAQAQPFELPQHNVSIAYPFAAGVYEVTVGQYRQFVVEANAESNGCSVYDGDWQQSNSVSWKNATEGQTDSYPVSCVSWQDAKRFAAWLSARTHHIYRLPSASEWEFAARGGSVASRPWTDPSEGCKYGNMADQTAAAHYPGWTVIPCSDKYAQAAPVGQFAPNALGLYDMLGNVFEWTEDCWADTYVGAPSDGSARTDADCAQRELRGGSWFTQPDYVRVSYRDRFSPDYRSTSIGFRLIREISE